MNCEFEKLVMTTEQTKDIKVPEIVKFFKDPKTVESLGLMYKFNKLVESMSEHGQQFYEEYNEVFLLHDLSEMIEEWIEEKIGTDTDDVSTLKDLIYKDYAILNVLQQIGNKIGELSLPEQIEQMIIYRDQDEREGWQDDRYTLSVRIGSEEVYCYHHCTSTAEVLVEELEEALKGV